MQYRLVVTKVNKPEAYTFHWELKWFRGWAKLIEPPQKLSTELRMLDLQQFVQNLDKAGLLGQEGLALYYFED